MTPQPRTQGILEPGTPGTAGRAIARVMYWGVGLGLAIALLLTASLRPRYTARSVLLATESQSIGVAGLLATAAQQAGFGIGAAGARLQLPRDLATDEEVLARIALIPLPSSSSDSGKMTLVSYFRVEGTGDRELAIRAARLLRDHLTVDINVGSGTLELRLTLRDSLLSNAALALLVHVVDSVQRASTVAHAASVRTFMEGQTSAAEAQLRMSEDSMESFLRANRTATGPALQAEQARRTRAVDVQTQLFLGLQTQLAQARLDEANKIPTLSFVIPPSPPALRDEGPLRLAIAAAALILVLQTYGWWSGRRLLIPTIPSTWLSVRRLVDWIAR